MVIEGHRALAAHFGHALAEALVWELADRLRRGLSADIAAARTAADEFTLIVSTTDREALQRQAADWLARLAEPLQLGGHRMRADLSAGTAWRLREFPNCRVLTGELCHR